MICFVILHYMTINETISSVEHILKNIKQKKKIIIIDNGSSNSTGMLLKDKYNSNSDIDVIINKDNLGFARGNNIGYLYAKEKYNPKYIVVMNNDVEIFQPDFYEKIDKIYKKEKFAVLSPDVFSTYSKIHQSPKRLSSLTEKEVKKEYKKFKFYNKSKIFIPFKCLVKEIKFLKKIVQNIKFKRKKIDYSKIYYNVPIHGSCMIFSLEFISKRDYAFYDKTFMYYESEILDYECHKYNLKTMYDPEIKVYHHHSISSIETYKSELKRERFVNKCMCDSLKAFIELMNK